MRFTQCMRPRAGPRGVALVKAATGASVSIARPASVGKARRNRPAPLSRGIEAPRVGSGIRLFVAWDFDDAPGVRDRQFFRVDQRGRVLEDIASILTNRHARCTTTTENTNGTARLPEAGRFF
jgi:hypothetical protein